jgi:parallel beta-helix repeat protein
MAGHNTTQNQKVTSRAIIGALVLVALAFSGMAAAEQLYVNESGWWREGGVFNASGAPIQAAVDGADAGDSMDGDYVIPEAIPPVEIYRDSNTTFNVSVTNHGNLCYDASLIFQDLPPGITLSPVESQVIDAGKTAEYQITIHASDDASVGAYTIEIADNVANDPYTWCPVLLSILPPASTAAEQLYVNESGWWQEGGAFNASGTPISAAVGAASAGDAIYVYGGTYSENVEVNKRLTLEGEGADVVTVTAKLYNDHVFEVTVDYVNISRFAVRGATDRNAAGIYLDNADYCNIFENNAYGNGYGIYLYSSSKNTLESNTVNSNYDDGISMSSSSNNTLTNNNVSSNSGGGIYLRYSSNNTLTGNSASDNKYYYGIRIMGSNNNTLTDNTATNNGYGIFMYDSNNNIIGHNNCSNNGDGIWLYYSSNNTLTSNTASNNYYGIHLYRSSSNMLANNTINSNNCGIRIDNADNNHVTCNWVHHNTQYGFYLSSGSTGNNINYNNIIENGNYNTGTGGWEWQFYMGKYQPVEAKHNYWGAGMTNSTIDASIYDDEEGWGKVEFYPFETEPVQCPLTPDEPPAFTTTDAAIALQIAAGSRPPDLRWDVSGDGSVTSLDALMILQRWRAA